MKSLALSLSSLPIRAATRGLLARLLIACALLWLLCAKTIAASGDLDTSFGSGGKLTQSSGSGDAYCLSTAVQGDGKILIAGYATNVQSNNLFTLYRRNSNGTPDTSFGLSGETTAYLGGTDYLSKIAVQPGDGKIVAVGASTVVNLTFFSVARWTATGTLDTAFSGGGQVGTIVGNGGYAYANGLAVQGDGKIVVAGWCMNGGVACFALVRYNSDGSLDGNFGAGGIVITPIGSGDAYGYSVALQNDGKIVVAGSADDFAKFAVVRYNTDGSLDNTFGAGGKVTTPVGSGATEAYGLAVQDDGDLVLIGYAYNGHHNTFAVVRYTTAGALDTGFGSGGVAMSWFSSTESIGHSVAIENDSRIIATGSVLGATEEFGLICYESDGSLDATFGGGIVLTSIAGHSDVSQSVALQNDGKILLAGFSSDGTKKNFAVARYLYMRRPHVTTLAATDVTATGATLHATVNAQDSSGYVFFPYGTTLSYEISDLQGTPSTVSGSGDTAISAKLSNLTPNTTYHYRCFVQNDTGDSDGADLTFTTPAVSDANLSALSLYDESSWPQPLTLLSPPFTGTNYGPYTVNMPYYDDSSSTMANWVILNADSEDSSATVSVNGSSNGAIAGGWENFIGPLAIGANNYSIKVTSGDGVTTNTYQLTVVRAAPAPGDYDLGFASQEYVRTAGALDVYWPIPTLDEVAGGVARQGDGKMIIAGYAEVGNVNRKVFKLARYNADGTLDTANFGGGTGEVTTAIGPTDDRAYAVTVDNNGKILVAGQTFDSSSVSHFALARYNPDGSLDTTFNSQGAMAGVVITSFSAGTSDGAKSVAFVPDPSGTGGKIVVAGYAGIPGNPATKFAVVRYNYDGSLDTTLNGTGMVTTAIGASAVGRCVAIQKDGSIVVGGDSDNGVHLIYAVARYQPNGTLDPAFNNGGTVTTSVSTQDCYGNSVALQSDGGIVLAGGPNSGSYTQVLRYTSGGLLDTNHFGASGIVTTGTTALGRGVVVQDDGRILVGGESGNRFAVFRFNADGSPDTTFNPANSSGYLVSLPFSANGATSIADHGRAMLVQPDGMIVLAGDSLFPTNSGTVEAFTLLRLHGDTAITADYANPLTVNDGDTLNGKTIIFPTIGFVPLPGSSFTVVKNLGSSPIQGSFSNLAQGQVVTLNYVNADGLVKKANFAVNYNGGFSKTDITLQWGDTRLLACGQNTFSQLGLGNGDTTNRNVVVGVDASVPSYGAAGIPSALHGRKVMATAAGQYHSLALCSDGTVAAWGFNNVGQLGNGLTTGPAISTPSAVQGTTPGLAFNNVNRKIIALAAGGKHNLALCSDGTVAAWGNNDHGQLGNGNQTASGLPELVSTAPGSALQGKYMVAIATGENFSLALCSDGTVAAWGSNINGQLGNGTTSDSPLPVSVPLAAVLNNKTVVAISAGEDHSLAGCSDGTIASWGANFQGELGNNSQTGSTLPALVVDSNGVLASRTLVMVSAGSGHSLALCSDGTVAAWGWGKNVPVALDLSGVASAGEVTAISAGSLHNLARYSDGTFVAWGGNAAGELGIGSTTDSALPVAVSTVSLAPRETFVAGTTGPMATHTLAIVAEPPPPVIKVQTALSPFDSGLSDGTGLIGFGRNTLGVAATQTFTLENSGIDDLIISSASIDGANAADFSISAFQPSGGASPGNALFAPAASPDASTFTLAPGASATFTVTFTAGGALGRSATLHLLSNDPNTPSLDIVLDGTGAGGLYQWQNFAGLPGGQGSVDGTGAAARFLIPNLCAMDRHTGNVYVADQYNSTIRMVTPAGVVSTLAGQPGNYGSADGPAGSAQFSYPSGVAVDGIGNVYVADTFNQEIRKVDTNNVVTTLAGIVSPYGGYQDGVGSAARFSHPAGIAVDALGENIYVADNFDVIRHLALDAAGHWTVTTVAGNYQQQYTVDGTGAAARFNAPAGLALDEVNGILYVAENGSGTIRKVVLSSAVVTTLAGTAGVFGDTDSADGPPLFGYPNGIALDGSGNNLYVADAGGSTIRKVTTNNGVVTTVAGSPGVYGSADGTGSGAQFYGPLGIAVDATNGNAYVVDGVGTIRLITPAAVVSTLAGYFGSYGSTDSAQGQPLFSSPTSVTVDLQGNVYVADGGNETIRKITSTGVVSTIAGTAGVSGLVDAAAGDAADAQFNGPNGLSVDALGNVYVADLYNYSNRKITPDGAVTTLPNYTAVQFWFPRGTAVDQYGNVYVVEDYNSVSKIAPDGTVTTLAGFRNQATGSSDGVGSEARFYNPQGLAVDANGENLYIADTNNCTIRKLVLATGQVTTIAGQAGQPGTADGDGGTARFLYPGGLAVDPSGTIFVADTAACTIRMITTAQDGTVAVTTIGGTAGAGTAMDGFATTARFSGPSSIAVAPDGKLYVADLYNDRIAVGIPLAQLVPVLAVSQGGSGLSSGNSAVDFGSLLPGRTITKSFTIANTGTVTLTGLGFGLSGASADFQLTAPSTTSLAPNASTNFTVSFSPPATGASAAVLRITSNDPNSPFIINLTGSGQDDVRQAVAATALVIDTTTNSADQTVTVTNARAAATGGIQLRIDGVPDGVSVIGGTYIAGSPGSSGTPAPSSSGYWLVNYGTILGGGQSAALAVQYGFTGAPVSFTPVVTIDLPPATIGSADPAFAAAMQRPIGNPADGSLLLNFRTVVGRSYQVDFGIDLQNWATATVPVTSRGSILQWIDDGSATGGSPATAPKRFYRVRDVTPP